MGTDHDKHDKKAVKMAKKEFESNNCDYNL